MIGEHKKTMRKMAAAVMVLITALFLREKGISLPDKEAVWFGMARSFLYIGLFAAWAGILIVSALGLMLKHCREPKRHRMIFLPLLPVGMILLYTVINVAEPAVMQHLKLGDVTLIYCLMALATLEAFLDNEQFAALMNSVKLDPAGWHQPGTAEVNGLLSDGGRIMSYSGSDEEVEIPAVIGEYNTVYIGPDAFADNTSLKKVVIPEGVTEIQPDAFYGCSNLETVVLPETLNFIYSNAFRDCLKLKDVVLPENERAGLEDSLRAHGIPAGASFEYYSLRG